MSQMWEVVHRLVAEAGLRLAPSRPVDNRKGPRVAPPEESPAVQSESDPRLRGEPLPDDDAPGPSCRPPRSAPAPPAAPASSSGPSTTPAPAPVPSACSTRSAPPDLCSAPPIRLLRIRLLQIPPAPELPAPLPRSPGCRRACLRSLAGCLPSCCAYLRQPTPLPTTVPCPLAPSVLPSTSSAAMRVVARRGGGRSLRCGTPSWWRCSGSAPTRPPSFGRATPS